MSSPGIHYIRNYNVSRLKGFAPFAYDHGVRKEIGLLKQEKMRFFFMGYECTVFSENNYGVMQQELNSYGRYGWKFVNAVCDNV